MSKLKLTPCVNNVTQYHCAITQSFANSLWEDHWKSDCDVEDLFHVTNSSKRMTLLKQASFPIQKYIVSFRMCKTYSNDFYIPYAQTNVYTWIRKRWVMACNCHEYSQYSCQWNESIYSHSTVHVLVQFIMLEMELYSIKPLKISKQTGNWINKCVPLSKYNMDISKTVFSYSDYYYKKGLTRIILHMGSENERQH